jgi:menaquinone-dependent protoporphyrinogen IX oxidase
MNSKSILVVCYSLTGNTARVAKDLAARLDADLEIIEDKGHGTGVLGQFAAAFDAWRKAPAHISAPEQDPRQYAITVVGTPVWVGQMTPAARAYLKEAHGRIQNVAFFVTSGDTDIAKILPSLESVAGQKAVASAGFSARELNEPAIYETKLAAFTQEIISASRSSRKVA